MKEFLIALIGLIGVIVGGWLSPWLSSRLEFSKTKKKLKPEIIRSLYIFCNIRKLAITLRNEHSYNGLVIRMMQIDNNKTDFPEEKRQANLENIRMLREINKSNLESLKMIFNDLVKEESNLLACVSEIQNHFNPSKYAFVDNLIQPEIDKSNSETDLFKYAEMNYTEYREIVVPNFKAKLDSALRQLDADFKRIANKIQVNL